jgi:hypothetical protein
MSYSQIKKEDIRDMDTEDNLKITTIDEKVHLLDAVEIQEDTLRGFDKSVYPNRVIEIPFDKISKLETEKSNAFLIIVIGVIVTIVVIAANSGPEIQLRNVGK